MKWLAGGLMFANFATIGGLLLGMIAAGLGPVASVTALVLAAGVAALAYSATAGPQPQPNAEATKVRYKGMVTSIVAAIFAIFAFRSFIWVLYVDGSDLKIQSPVNLG